LALSACPTGADVFCHSRVLRHAGLGASLPVGQRVEIDIETAADGRLRVARIIRASVSAVV
jgi:cold shock CspA family protein